MKPTLFVLAAGMGSRYGGLKQLDGVGPNGETIMDYSIFDAICGGFGKVVFVIRKDFEADFRHKNKKIKHSAKLLANHSQKQSMDALEELSKEYPDVDFLHFSGFKMNNKNFGNYFGATEEPRYLSGIVAGMQTKSNKIGYVAAHPYTEILIGIDEIGRAHV